MLAEIKPASATIAAIPDAYTTIQLNSFENQPELSSGVVVAVAAFSTKPSTDFAPFTTQLVT